MYTSVDTRHPTEVEIEVQRLYRGMLPDGDRAIVSRAFDWATAAFTGKYRHYQSIDTQYHDYEHTLQVALCLVRLLQGRHQARVEPKVTLRLFELGLLASLFHDTGYLKTADDTVGTGAKYTPTHVERSANFAEVLMSDKGFPAADIKAVQDMIRCTDFFLPLSRIQFASEEEKLLGLMLATADLLGQMADENYVEKLPKLFSEFKEADEFRASNGSSDTTTFTSAKDLMRKTPIFWETIVKNKINGDYRGLYRFLSLPYPDGPNWYIQQIEANLKRLEEVLRKRRSLSSAG